MKIQTFLFQVRNTPDDLTFIQAIDIIDSEYHFTPTSFINGNQHNEAGQNNGSCKIFAFGLLHNLTEQQTLACFGDYYRKDVVSNPDADDHQNIRQFMLHGWSGIKFSGQTLVEK